MAAPCIIGLTRAFGRYLGKDALEFRLEDAGQNLVSYRVVRD
jgi:hypothetical protein